MWEQIYLRAKRVVSVDLHRKKIALTGIDGQQPDGVENACQMSTVDFRAAGSRRQAGGVVIIRRQSCVG